MSQIGDTVPAPTYLIKNRFGIYYYRFVIPNTILTQIPAFKKELRLSTRCRSIRHASRIAAYWHYTFFSIIEQLNSLRAQLSLYPWLAVKRQGKNMADNENASMKRVTIKTETGSKWFDDPEKLVRWIQDQQKTYRRLDNIARNYELRELIMSFDQSWNHLKSLGGTLINNVGSPESYNKVAHDFSKGFNDLIEKRRIFTEEAPFYEFYQEQLELVPEKALAVLATYFDRNMKPIDRTMWVGLMEAESYFSGHEPFKENQTEAMKALRYRWDESFKEAKAEFSQKLQSEIEEVQKLNDQSKLFIESWQKSVNEQKKELESERKVFSEQFKAELEETQDELENLTTTYDKKLSLHASVRYWGLQQKGHRIKSIWFGIALVISVIAVIWSIIYFSSASLNKPFNEILISKLITTAIITTFGIWTTKVLANIFMSHLHLATDAQERRTMIHTYLALVRKGQGPKEDERHLILQTLFRPSSTDMVKSDEGPSAMTDFLSKLSAK